MIAPLDYDEAVVVADEPLAGIVAVVGGDDVVPGRLEYGFISVDRDSHAVRAEAASAFAEDLDRCRLARTSEAGYPRVDLSPQHLPAERDVVESPGHAKLRRLKRGLRLVGCPAGNAGRWTRTRSLSTFHSSPSISSRNGTEDPDPSSCYPSSIRADPKALLQMSIV